MIPHRQHTFSVGSGFCDECGFYTTHLFEFAKRSICFTCALRGLVVRWLQERPAERGGGWHRRYHLLVDMIEAGWVDSYLELRRHLDALIKVGRIEEERTVDERGSLLWYRVAGGER